VNDVVGLIGRIPRAGSRARPRHLEQGSRGDPVRGAIGSHGGNQLPDTNIQVQRTAGGLRGVFKPLQPISDERGRDEGVEE